MAPAATYLAPTRPSPRSRDTCVPTQTQTRTLQPARILCVDDHPILLHGLRERFTHDGTLEMVGSIGTAEHLLDAIEESHPDLILLDIEMPGPDVFEVADRLRHRHPGLRFAFLSAYTRDGYLAAACRCGAWGYFSKSDPPDDIITGLKSILRSTRPQFIMSPGVAANITHTHNDSDPHPAEPHRELHVPQAGPGSLTSRELEVLHLIGKGLTRLEIARELSRSVKTIDGHQDRIMKKLSAACRADLIRYAIREGLAEA